MTKSRICIGKIAAPHGIKGLVKLIHYGDDPHLLEGNLYTSKDGAETLEITLKNPMNKFWLADIKGVNNRDRSEEIKGTELYIDRDTLPTIEEDNSFYFTDLEGLQARDEQGVDLGVIKSAHNFGAGDLLELVQKSGENIFVPFTKAHVPDIFIDEGYLILILPEEL